MFWALMVDMDALIASVGMKAKLLNLPTAPTAAEALTPPTMFTIAVINRKEILVAPFCIHVGSPILKMSLS
jgi:hypothetical protein